MQIPDGAVSPFHRGDSRFGAARAVNFSMNPMENPETAGISACAGARTRRGRIRGGARHGLNKRASPGGVPRGWSESGGRHEQRRQAQGRARRRGAPGLSAGRRAAEGRARGAGRPAGRARGRSRGGAVCAGFNGEPRIVGSWRFARKGGFDRRGGAHGGSRESGNFYNARGREDGVRSGERPEAEKPAAASGISATVAGATSGKRRTSPIPKSAARCAMAAANMTSKNRQTSPVSRSATRCAMAAQA